jgi:probable rRNA maturation factor
MRALNKRFRSKDTTTDVLSFRYGEETINHDCCPMGEILLSETKIEHQSREHGVRKEEECFHLIIHGILHVLGFDHEKAHDAANMEEHEQAILHTLITRKRES